jgi:hypothetical protein
VYLSPTANVGISCHHTLGPHSLLCGGQNTKFASVQILQLLLLLLIMHKQPPINENPVTLLLLLYSGTALRMKWRRVSTLLLYSMGLCTVVVLLWSQYESVSQIVGIREENQPAQIDPVSILLFKLPRSGSSWLTDRLNSYPNVFISKEILQTNDSLRMSAKRIERHLISALQRPTDKAVPSKSRWFPYTTRYLEDYIYKGKFARKMDYVGFSINPEHVSGR